MEEFCCLFVGGSDLILFCFLFCFFSDPTGCTGVPVNSWNNPPGLWRIDWLKDTEERKLGSGCFIFMIYILVFS